MRAYMGVAGLALGLMAGAAAAQELDVSGQVRPRFEVRDLGEGGTVESTSMRTRLAVAAELASSVSAFVQFQDVRTFGEEGNTLGDYSADGLDLHQGWVELGDAGGDAWAVRVGRQEASYGGQRLVGAVNWTQQGRAFDGGRLRVRPAEGVVVDGLAFRISEGDVAAAGEPVVDHGLYGVYATVAAAGELDLFGLWDAVEAATELDRVTLGARWASSGRGLSWRVEGAYQTGGSETAGGQPLQDISAYMLGARVGTRVAESVGVTLWYDYLSGDGDPADDVVRVFDTLYATNHKFYGFMDLFLNVPVHTAFAGLQDLAVKTSWDLAADKSLGVDLHAFRAATSDRLASGRLGEEADVTFRWRYAPGVSLASGASYFVAGEGWSAIGRGEENRAWGFLMLDVAF